MSSFAFIANGCATGLASRRFGIVAKVEPGEKRRQQNRTRRIWARHLRGRVPDALTPVLAADPARGFATPHGKRQREKRPSS